MKAQPYIRQSPVSAYVLAFAALVSTTVGTASAATQWGTYRWQNRPINLVVRMNVSGAWAGYVSPATTIWNAAAYVELSATPETGSVNRSTCKGPNNAVEVCNAKYGNNGWLGIAQIWTSGSYIVKGTVKLNDSYFNLTAYNTPAWKQLVSCQEIGHTIGLGHDDTNFNNANFGTCMDYTNAPGGGGTYGAANTAPNTNDYALLDCIYISTTTCGTPSQFVNSPIAAATVVDTGPQHMPTNFGIRTLNDQGTADVDPGNSPAEWGKAVAFTKDGRGRIYERMIGKGQKIITEVFWTPR